ncbi:hypothetical protein JYG23_04640 [Sedimentibacter sp. zth1]|uniref:hypothetical protein n=1 Tax=Sedimentibacter sp. zth1 TaxID=2816908 RepID=UPI001A936D1F|nr:hypothetical protein [Sedimentibacter sp. zth1]QSX06737.1 hypothetical protein JYG23_04640 [Sedimentibacter sp. zth1]
MERDRIKNAKGSEKPVEVYSEETLESVLFHLEKSESKNIGTVWSDCLKVYNLGTHNIIDFLKLYY